MSSRRHKRAFTLVELLVVIALIAMLMAMLLPALQAARKAARISLCGSQLRQHGIGLNAYQVDNAIYYPLFGGPPLTSLDTYGRIESTGDGGLDGVASWRFNTAVFNNFGSYIGLFTTPSGTTPVTSLAQIKYCPVVDWSKNGAYSPIRPDYYGTNFVGGAPGYAFYSGRMMNGSTQGNFNTIRRRSNPRELLMSDHMLFDWTQNEDWSALYGTIVSTAFPWLNPHFDRSCVAMPSGSANELAADGHVANTRFTGSLYLSGYYALYFFEGSVTNGSTGNMSRGAPWDATPACDCYPITP